MLFSQTIDNIDSEITALLAQVEVAKQRQTQLIELDALTDHTLEGLADVVSKIQCNAPDAICASQQRFAIASLKSAVLTLFDSGDDGNDGGNQPTDPMPDTDPDEPELLCLNGITGDCLTSADLDDDMDDTKNPETLSRGSRFWFGAPDNTGTVLELVGNGEYKVQIDGAVGEVTLERHHCHYFLEPLTGQTVDTDKAPLTGQHCTITFSSPDSAGESMAYCEFVKVSDAFGGRACDHRVGYIRVNTTGEIIATYAGFNNKSRAKSWANYLETMTSRIELRAAKRLGNWKHELKISGLSMTQIERLAAENLDKMPPDKEPSLPPTYKPQPIPQPVNPDEVEPGDIVTALLTPSASYRVEQVMPNGILDCTNLTTGDRLGLRPDAVSLVQKVEQPELKQQVIDLEFKPDAPTKYARVKLKGESVALLRSADRFDGQVFAVVKGNELGSTLATSDGHHWFRTDCLEFIDPDAQTTTGNYKGLSKQMKQHWEKVGINPSDLISDMKANRPTEPEWNAAKYNPVLAAVGAGDDLDF
jgi:hypothetical protein